MGKFKVATPSLAAALVACLTLLPGEPAYSQEKPQLVDPTAGPITPSDERAKKQQKSAKKPKPNKEAVGNAKPAGDIFAAPVKPSESAPSLKRGAKPEESPISVDAHWSATNATNYGVNSTTTQDDILRRNIGEPTSTPDNKVDVGVNFKF